METVREMAWALGVIAVSLASCWTVAWLLSRVVLEVLR